MLSLKMLRLLALPTKNAKDFLTLLEKPPEEVVINTNVTNHANQDSESEKLENGIIMPKTMEATISV